MTIEQQIQAHKLDHYRDRTGDYTPPVIPIVVSRERKKPPTSALRLISQTRYWKLQDKQNNRCAICGGRPTKYALHLDHCHETKKIRGLICHGCNIAIGMIKEDSDTARAIADYLDKHASLSLKPSMRKKYSQV